MDTEQLLKDLGEHFPQSAIKQRSGGGGKMLSYVEGHTVIHRLNDATKGVWDFRVLSLDWRDSLLLATVELTIPGLGTRQHVGIQEVKGGVSDIVKGAVTDALKKVATLFGVGLELYGSDYAEEAKPAPPAAPAQPDPRVNLLNALAEQAKLHGIEELAPKGDIKACSKLARTICESVAREVGKSVTTDDILTAITNIALWAEYQRAPIASEQTPVLEDTLPELQNVLPSPETENDPPFEDGTLFPAPEPTVVAQGSYVEAESIRRGDAEPQGRKNSRK